LHRGSNNIVYLIVYPRAEDTSCQDFFRFSVCRTNERRKNAAKEGIGRKRRWE